jgi:hypothetical protein
LGARTLHSGEIDEGGVLADLAKEIIFERLKKRGVDSAELNRAGLETLKMSDGVSPDRPCIGRSLAFQ